MLNKASDFVGSYDLINSRPDETEAENAILWTLQNCLLNRELGLEDEFKAQVDVLVEAIDKCRIKPGFFHQTPVHHDRPFRQKDGYMSPDQLITIFLAGYLFEGTHEKAIWHKEIWQEIKNQGYLRYNNLEDGKNRWIHPRDLALYFACNNPTLGQLALVILALANVVACKNDRSVTSGKLLAWTKMLALSDEFFVMKWAWKTCTKIVNKIHGTWADVFKVYFPIQGHPNANMAKKLYEIQ